MRNLASSALCALILASPAPSVRAESPPHDYPFRPVPFSKVALDDRFWGPRLETNRRVTIWYDFKKCEETGRIDNFSHAGGLTKGEFAGIPFNDSDVYKVIEAAAYSLALHQDPKLETYLRDLIRKIASAQEEDGYLYTARRLLPPAKLPKMAGQERWSNLESSHELYNVGHLYEAAVAHFEATGETSLLNVATRNADLLLKVFGSDTLQEPPGHQEIEIGLAKLYRATGKRAYLDLAKFFLDIRGREETHKLRGPKQQDRQPVTEQSEAVGHAVRAGYMYAGMADVAALNGEASYIRAIGKIWDNVVEKKLHLTGGIGARRSGEAFGDDYELPNETAYNETCAAIANILWNHRMFLLHGDAKYIDLLERTLYNGFLSGTSLSGDKFFYPNPLESDGRKRFNQGASERQPWFGCSCCPVNVVRLFGSLGGLVYATHSDIVYVNLFVGSQTSVELRERKVVLRQETGYPWEGTSKLHFQTENPTDFELRVRVPGWATNRPVPSDLYRYADSRDDVPVWRINGTVQSPVIEKGYALFRREWRSGDTLDVAFPMHIRRVLAHDAVMTNAGRAAVERGPIVYCAEGADHDGRALDLVLPDESVLSPEHRADLLGGVTVLRGEARRIARDDNGDIATQRADLTLIPYYAWCHRGPNEMAVWLPRTPDKARIPPTPSLANRATASASHCHSADGVDALADDAEPANSNDHDIPRFTWWDRKGTEEWAQYDFDKPTKISSVSVYWFDDTGRGQCRVPASWKLLRWTGNEWEPIAANYQIKKDAWNELLFPENETAKLRLVVQLQPKFSGGILEWRVK